ncbi:unnamed protein product, partial [Adineta steineri]
MKMRSVFDSWERAKNSFDELLVQFSPTHSDIHSSVPSNKPIRSYGRQSSLDSPSTKSYKSGIDEAPNLIYIFIKDDVNLQQGSKLEDVFLDFVQSKV